VHTLCFSQSTKGLIDLKYSSVSPFLQFEGVQTKGNSKVVKKRLLGFTAKQLLFELKSKKTTGDASLLPLFVIVMIRKSIQEDN